MFTAKTPIMPNDNNGGSSSDSSNSSSRVRATPRVTTAVKGLNPMRFPHREKIPVTEEELHAQGVRFCLHKILEQNRCMARAKDAYLAEGLDTMKGPQWYYYHLRMCFNEHKAANQCVIDHKELELRERQKRIREKRLGMVHV